MTRSCLVSFGFVSLKRLQVRLFPGRSVRDDTSDPSRQTGNREATDGPRDPRFREVTNKRKRHVRVMFQIGPSLSEGSRSVSLHDASPDRRDTFPPRQTGDRGTTDGPRDPKFGEITNEGKRHARVWFRLVSLHLRGPRSVSFQEGPSGTTRPTSLGRGDARRQPTARGTPDLGISQTRVNDTSVPCFESFRLSRKVPGPSLSQKLRPSKPDGHPTVNGRRQANREPERPQILRGDKRG